MDKIANVIGKVVMGIAFWVILALTYLFMANVVLGAEQQPTSPYRDIIMAMTDEEIEEIQQVLYWEAKDDTWEGRVATAQVMFNRVLSDEFPDTVHGVLSQKKPCTQYSTYHKRSRAKYDERECDAIEFLCDCNVEDLIIGTDRLYQDCNPIGKHPIKVGKQWFGL